MSEQNQRRPEDIEKIKNFILEAPIGQYIGEEGAKVLAEHAGSIVKLKSDDYLFRKGELTNSFFLVVDGHLARIEETPKGLKPYRVIHTLHRGDLVGELSFIDDTPHTMSVIALGDATVLQFSADEIKPLITTHPQLMYDFMRAIIKRVHHTLYSLNQQQSALQDYISSGARGRV